MLKLLITSSLTLLLIGCSLFDQPKIEPKQIISGAGVISERGFNLDILYPKSDTVGMVPGRRHTLGYPDNYRRSVSKTHPIKSNSGLQVISGTIEKPQSLWDRYCSGEFIASEITENILAKKNIPTKWVGRCRPLK